jgi:hypothetical protein
MPPEFSTRSNKLYLLTCHTNFHNIHVTRTKDWVGQQAAGSRQQAAMCTNPFKHVGRCRRKWSWSTINYSYYCIEVKLSLCLTDQALRYEIVRENGCMDLRILDEDTSWSWVVSFTPRPLYTRGPSTHCNRSWVRCAIGLTGVKKRIILCLKEMELRPLGRRAHSSCYIDSLSAGWKWSKDVGVQLIKHYAMKTYGGVDV